ncbi:hypothetical protein J2857_001608 [Neorhizobium galegae]|uniref:hypothetical protein n=1 Tax=Neorhizobium galegae TaxID=399 RepID=UPI001AEA2CFC|nr:hypothetical protein [Neorhizobium galegae]MBP2558857.1 hypothetical protein [Neorhizobium galegae]
MQQPPMKSAPDRQPPGPSRSNPVPPAAEARSDGPPDEAPDPDLRRKPKYAPQDLVKNYGLSAQEAQRLIDRFGPSAAGLDFILAGKGRPRRHRRQDMERSAEEIAFG